MAQNLFLYLVVCQLAYIKRYRNSYKVQIENDRDQSILACCQSSREVINYIKTK